MNHQNRSDGRSMTALGTQVPIPRAMLAVTKQHRGPGFSLVEKPVRPPKAHEVLIKVSRVGLCGTDRAINADTAWAQTNVPLGGTIGHEFTGKVVSVGSECQSIRVGDRVSVECHTHCGQCHLCASGLAHVCKHGNIIGVHQDGALAEYVSAPAKNCRVMSSRISDDSAALMDPFGNAVHIVDEGGVCDKTVLITGSGPLGLMSTQVAYAKGAARVIVVDKNQFRLNLAEQFGAIPVLSDEGWVSSVEQAAGEAVDVVLEVSGSIELLRGAIEALRPGGTVAQMGLFSKPELVDINRELIFKQATWKGLNGRRIWDTWDEAEALLKTSSVDLQPLISHRLPMREFEQAFALLDEGKALKILLEVGSE